MFRFTVLVLVAVCTSAITSAAPIHRLPHPTIQTPSPVPFSNCGPNDLLQSVSLFADPWPPVTGPLTVYIDGNLTQTVADGTYNIKITLSQLPIPISLSGDLSSLTTVPIPAGNVSLVYKNTLPLTPGSGSKIHITANDNQGTELVCIDVTVDKSAERVTADCQSAPEGYPYSVTFTSTCAAATDKAPVSCIWASEPIKPGTPAGTKLVSVFNAVEALSNVDAGEYVGQVSWDGIPLGDATKSTMKDAGFPDTIQKGSFSVVGTQGKDIPVSLPPGVINTITGTDGNGARLFCAEILMS